MPPLSAIGVIVTPEQTVWDVGVAIAAGAGFTTTVALMGASLQPLAVATMVNVTVTAAVVVLASTPVILPVPLAAMPVTVAVIFLVQL